MAIKEMRDKISFLDIKIDLLTRNDMVDVLLKFSKGEQARTAFYLNAHCMNISFADLEYKKILQKADLVYAGGQGVVWAARFLGIPLPERVNILDFFDALAEQLIDEGITVYLLGSKIDTVKRTEKALKQRGLKIVGGRDGFFTEQEETVIIQEINSLRPNILMVGMGAPKQEKWVYAHLNKLDVNLCWGVGAVFDWLSGKRKRAPRWMIKSGLEWLHRLFQQPSRLWKRYLIGNIIFVYRVLKWKISHGENN